MATLTVGSGSGFEYNTLASAVAASQDGDVIQVQAGTYINDFATITSSITIEGVGGMVYLKATEPPPNLKGILTIGTDGSTGPNVTLDNIAFSGAAIPDADGGNAAGIRYQSGNLVLNNTFFYGNQDGLLADASTGTITINKSEFQGNGNTDAPAGGNEHNLYVGAIQQLTINDSYFTDPILGHDIKSRAANTTIQNTRIEDPNGTGSYQVDLPNGGNAVIQNDVIEKGANAQNSNFISFGEEGSLYPGGSLTVTGNTLVNDDGSNANVVVNDTTTGASITGNAAYGLTSSQLATGPTSSTADNTYQPQSSEPAPDTSAPYLPVMPFTFACFAAGTRIRTTQGAVPVEALRVGQHVTVVRPDGAHATRPIRWIGHRSINFARHANPDLARPIRIRADAFRDGQPARDLLVSPDHAIHVAGLLIPARLLMNGATILREDRLRKVRYFHIELDQHDILLADDLPTESYLDTGNRNLFENAGEPMVLHPDLTADEDQARREASSCRPFAADVQRVHPVWKQLAIRASQLGYQVVEPVTTTDPALHLLVDGQVRWPVTTQNDCHVFVLPRSAASVRLVSRASAPCDIAPWVEDRRRLGVAVERIVLEGPAGTFDVPADHPLLTDGWWAAERQGPKLWRWTTGNAALRLPPGVATIAIHLTGDHTYRYQAEAGQAAAAPQAMSA